MRMRVCWAVAFLALTGILQFSSLTAKAQVGIQFTAGIDIHGVSDFHDPLAPLGVWVDLPEYGRCWHPYVEHGWIPYSNGQWEWTDCGWYWASNDPWAWACYHYGSWVHSPIRGWLWLPGTEWAPAWVVWRQGPDYIGWAPCGFRGAVPPPSSFWFVDVHHFHDQIRPSALVVNNTTIINRTRVINNISRETRSFDGRRERVVVNRGPGVEPIQKVTGTRFAPRPVRDVVRQEPLPERLQTEGRVQPWRSQGARFVPDRPQQGRGAGAATQAAPTQSGERFNERERSGAPQAQPTPPPTASKRTTEPPNHAAPQASQPPAVTQPVPRTVTPQQPEASLPPTGRDRNGARRENFSEVPQPQSAAPTAPEPPGRERDASKREVPAPAPQPPVVTPTPAPAPAQQRALPPGQERKIERSETAPARPQPPEVTPPPAPEQEIHKVPATQPENPAGHERGRDRDPSKDKEKP